MEGGGDGEQGWDGGRAGGQTLANCVGPRITCRSTIFGSWLTFAVQAAPKNHSGRNEWLPCVARHWWSAGSATTLSTPGQAQKANILVPHQGKSSLESRVR